MSAYLYEALHKRPWQPPPHEHGHIRGHPTGRPDPYDDILSEGSPLDIDPYYDPFEDPFRFIPSDTPKDIDDLGARGRPPPVGSPGATIDITAVGEPPEPPIGRGPLGGIAPRILEQWRIQGAEDLLCTQWDRTVWPIGTGPHPVTDTHPNCRCIRVPYAESHIVRRLRAMAIEGRLP